VPDITLCRPNGRCRAADTCYRASAEPSDYQSYANFAPTNGPSTDKDKCEYYMGVKER